MTKSEAVIRSILGAARFDVRPLAYSIDLAIDLMFQQKMSMNEIFVTSDIYPEVAKLLRKRSGSTPSVSTVSRRIERLANHCWDALQSRNLVEEYFGTQFPDIRAPRDIIFYLAVYTHLDLPFFTVTQQYPALLS